MRGLRLSKRALSFQTIFGHDLERTGNYGATRVTTESARRSMAVWACQSLISGDIATLPLQPYRKVGDDNRESLPTPSWINEPNPANANFTIVSHKRQAGLSLAQEGNAFVGVFPDVFNPLRLLVLNPSQVQEKDGEDSPVYEVTGANGRQLEVLSPLNLIHVPFILPPGEKRGLNPIEAARTGIAIDIAAQQQSLKFFDGGGLITGIIEIPAEAGVQDNKKIEDIRESFRRQRSGPSGYSVGVLQGGAAWKNVGMSQADAQYLETRKFQLEEIARLYLIPPFMVGSQEASGVAYASAVERAQFYIDHCLTHYTTPIEAGYRRLLNDPDAYLKFNFNALLRGDTKTRYEAYGIALQNKFKTIDDVRRLEDDEPFGGTDGGFLETPNNNGPRGATAA
jgi:HK97 family phage portal protein